MKNNQKNIIKSNLKGMLGNEYGNKLLNLLDPCCSSAEGVVDVTYTELQTLISNESLVAGSLYKITDFQTVHLIPNTADVNTSPAPTVNANAFLTWEDGYGYANGDTVTLDVDGVTLASYVFGSGGDDLDAGINELQSIVNSGGSGYTVVATNPGGGGGGTFNEVTITAPGASVYNGLSVEIIYSSTPDISGTLANGYTQLIIPIEPLIVGAISTSELAAEAYSPSNPDDVIYYTPDNSWWGALVHANSKGAIYRRIDTVQNIDMCQDFRACVLRRYEADLTSFDGRVDEMCLWQSSGIEIGKDSTTVYDSLNTLNSTDAGATFTDHFTFGDYANSSNVKIVAAYDTRILANLVVLEYVKNIEIAAIGDVHIHGILEGVRIAGFMTNVITAPNSINISSGTPAGIKYETGDSYAIDGLLSVMHLVVLVAKSAIWGSTITRGDGSTKEFQIGQMYGFEHSYVNVSGTMFGGANCQIVKMDINRMVIINAYTDSAPETNWLDLDIWSMNGGSWPPVVQVLDYTGSPQRLNYNRVKGYSSIEITKAAISAMVLNVASNDAEQFAGQISLTGSGAVTISTFNPSKPNWNPIHQRIVLKPVSGLTITINFNDVDYGFLNTTSIVANGTNGEIIVIEPISEKRWKAM